jgi:hypothetical protein
MADQVEHVKLALLDSLSERASLSWDPLDARSQRLQSAQKGELSLGVTKVREQCQLGGCTMRRG